jgi:phage terminase small subunit
MPKRISKMTIDDIKDGLSHDQLVGLFVALSKRVDVLNKKMTCFLSKLSGKKAEIKKDLIDQLDRNGVLGNQYQDLVDDYMALWSIKNDLIMDIRARGVSVEWSNGVTQGGFKKNESIAELNKTNAQMLKILNELGLKAKKTEAPGGDHEDM